MSVRITGVGACLKELQEIEDFLNSPKPMEGIVEDIQKGILVNTALGKDFKGRGFEPYSAAYKKRKTGMTATGRPNLKRTGTMLGAMEAKVITPQHGRVSIEAVPEPAGKISSDMLANIHNTGTGKQPERRFMDITESGIRKIVKERYDDPILEIVRRYR